jgi:membrane-associated phospholipid phosphatase
MEASHSSESPAGSTKSQRLLTGAIVVGLVAAGLALWLFAWLGHEILTDTPAPVLDDRLRLAIHSLASPGLTRVMIAASRYGGPAWLAPLGGLVAIAFLARGWRRGALLVVVTMAGAGLLDTLLKLAFARPRPTAFFNYSLPLSHSFPSGHAFFAGSFFGGLALLLSARVRSRIVRWAVWVVAVLLTLLIGGSRVYLGVHYPSDVLAGYAAAIVWVAAVAFGDRLVSHRRRQGLA